MNRHLATGNDPLNPTEGITFDPATRHSYITTWTNINIGPPGVFLPEHVKLQDIMQSLAQSARYYGHLDEQYSVAEHSVLVSRMAELAGDEEAVIPALFHDAHETYMGDIASPQKDMIHGEAVRDWEDRMERVTRLGLDLPDQDDDVWRRVRVWDIQILHRELKNLRREHPLPDWYNPNIEALVHPSIQPVGLPWREARSMFRARVHDLGWGLGGNA